MLKVLHKYAGNYIKDAVFAANDGIITTFAIVAGVAGASLSITIVLILGFANLIADGFSMATGNYLGSRSGTHPAKTKQAEKAGAVTFFAFTIAGLIPLLPYVGQNLFNIQNPFNWAIAFTAIALFTVGSTRTHFSDQKWVKGGLEMLFVGGTAAVIAYVVGSMLKSIVNGGASIL